MPYNIDKSSLNRVLKASLISLFFGFETPKSELATSQTAASITIMRMSLLLSLSYISYKNHTDSLKNHLYFIKQEDALFAAFTCHHKIIATASV